LRSLKLSCDGKIIAAGFRSSITLYDTETWKELQTLAHPPLKGDDSKDERYFMKFSRSGQYLVSETHEFNVLVWSLEDGKLKAVFDGHIKSIWGLDISSDDVFVASGAFDKTLRFWDLRRADHKAGLVSLPERTYTIAFAMGPPVLAAAVRGHGVWFIEVPTGSIIAKVDTAANVLLRFSATGCWLVADSSGGNLTCWSTADLLSDKIEMEQGVSVKGQGITNFKDQ
ncbi:U3 snoRNP protein, partial [Tulasnella sp. 403]